MDSNRQPVLALLRRRLSAEAAMWKAWAIISNDREDPTKLRAYVRQLRRVDLLQQTLTHLPL